MALGIVQQGPGQVPGAAVRKTLTLTGDASYPNPAGYVITPAALGLLRITKMEDPIAATAAAGAWDPVLIPTYASDGSGAIVSVALHLIVQTTGVEVANAVNVAAAVFTFNVEGN